MGLSPDHPRVRRTARQMGFEHAYHWIDFFRWSQRPIEALVATVDTEGEEHFLAARRSGRGTVLITAHMGNAEVGASGLGRHLEPIHILYHRDRFATAERFRNRMRAHSNVHGIPVDATPLSVIPALRVLQERGVLAAHGDRDFNNQGWPFEFFGKVTTFPAGIFLLAVQADALIVPPYFLVKSDRRFLGIYEPPIETRGPGSVEDRARAIMAAWLKTLEARILEYPEQWFCFYPFWAPPPSRSL
jgi:lauroyl/myristoyl acyltransferase